MGLLKQEEECWKVKGSGNSGALCLSLGAASRSDCDGDDAETKEGEWSHDGEGGVIETFPCDGSSASLAARADAKL